MPNPLVSPALFDIMTEALAEAGVAQGLPRPLALALARKTMLGAAKLLEREHPAILKENVMSPGGTTAAGLGAFASALQHAANTPTQQPAFAPVQNLQNTNMPKPAFSPSQSPAASPDAPQSTPAPNPKLLNFGDALAQGLPQSWSIVPPTANIVQKPTKPK